MKKANWLLRSLWLNLLLTAGVIAALKIPPKIDAPKIRVVKKAALKMEAMAVKTNPVAEVKANPPAPFSWRQIESEDFSVYISNLRNIGCPETTIREIITADVKEMFVRRRQEMFEPFENQFWDYVARTGKMDSAGEDLNQKIERLGKEAGNLLEKLLGKEMPEEKPKPENVESVYENRLADILPEEKIKALHEIGAKFSEQERQLANPALKDVNVTSKEGVAKTVDELRRQCRTEQEALLTPGELEEFKLRSSPARNELSRLVGFEASEEELRRIAQFRMDINPKAPDAKAKIAAANEEIKHLLGEERFAAFRRAEDPEFRNVYSVASRYNLPEDVMTNFYEMQRDVRRKAQQVQNNKSLSPDEREDLFDAMQAETERAFSGVLGKNVFKTYRKYGGKWIEKLGEP